MLAFAGVTDWLDGHLARRAGHTSCLGSYLDPFADKVLISSVVATLGLQELLPLWLVTLVVARDGAQVGAVLFYRSRSFGGRWPGAARFFDVDAPGEGGGSGEGTGDGGGAGGLPRVEPLMVSKVNTTLVLLLVGGALTQQWLGQPDAAALAALEAAVAATTAASAAAYAYLYAKGKLLRHGKR